MTNYKKFRTKVFSNCLLCATCSFLMGISGCDFRVKVAAFKYRLSGCPEIPLKLPDSVKDDQWEITYKEPSRSRRCQTAKKYLLVDQRRIAGMGPSFGHEVPFEFYGKIIKEKNTCSLVIAAIFDKADVRPELRYSDFAARAATMLVQGHFKVKTANRTYTEVGGLKDFKKWCATGPSFSLK